MSDFFERPFSLEALLARMPDLNALSDNPLPVNGGRPSRGTPADKRLRENKGKPMPKPPAQPPKKG